MALYSESKRLRHLYTEKHILDEEEAPEPQIVKVLTERALWIGLFIRLFLAWFLPWFLDEKGLLPGVAYTDIDFYVFTDAAEYIKQGMSPYDRTTYRYTPFLAALLARLPHRECGRYLFCLADAMCGWIILQFRRQNRLPTKQKGLLSPELQDALWWLYNPLAINICTRGSAESLLVLLPVLVTIWISTQWIRSRQSAAMAGFCHGVAVHAKLYPIIYTLSFMTAFVDQNKSASIKSFSQLPSFLIQWTRRLLKAGPIIFAISFLLSFDLFTYLSVFWYGPVALEEGLLYHFSRVDHRHNYSMHWYWIYLARAREYVNMELVGQFLLLPQFILLLVCSLGIAPNNLPLALFVQTFLFVAYNKVITAQYFTWYLCLLPLCSDSLALTRRVVIGLAILLLSVAFWLGSAYCLEMRGMAVHRVVWMASIVFFGANVNLMGALLDSSRVKARAKNTSSKLD